MCNMHAALNIKKRRRVQCKYSKQFHTVALHGTLVLFGVSFQIFWMFISLHPSISSLFNLHLFCTISCKKYDESTLTLSVCQINALTAMNTFPQERNYSVYSNDVTLSSIWYTAVAKFVL